MAEMSTDFSTACGKLLGITMEKSTGKGGFFHRGIAPLQSSIFCQKKAVEKGAHRPTFFEKGVAFLNQVCYNGVVKISYLPVAQLDSASDSDSEGRRFESFRVGQQKSTHLGAFLLLITKFDLARDTSAEGSHTVYGICAFARIPFRVFYCLSQSSTLRAYPFG